MVNPSQLPVVVVADRQEAVVAPQEGIPDSAPLHKSEFVANYISSSPEQKMAMVLLPERQMTVAEWRALWRTLLNSPAP